MTYVDFMQIADKFMEIQELSANRQESEFGTYGDQPLTSRPTSASLDHWRRARRNLSPWALQGEASQAAAKGLDAQPSTFAASVTGN